MSEDLISKGKAAEYRKDRLTESLNSLFAYDLPAERLADGQNLFDQEPYGNMAALLQSGLNLDLDQARILLSVLCEYHLWSSYSGYPVNHSPEILAKAFDRKPEAVKQRFETLIQGNSDERRKLMLLGFSPEQAFAGYGAIEGYFNQNPLVSFYAHEQFDFYGKTGDPKQHMGMPPSTFIYWAMDRFEEAEKAKNLDLFEASMHLSPATQTFSKAGAGSVAGYWRERHQVKK